MQSHLNRDRQSSDAKPVATDHVEARLTQICAVYRPKAIEQPRKFNAVRIDSAHDLTEQAGRHLRRLLGPPARRFTLVCNDEEFYLAGRVASWYEKQVAQEALRNIVGARQIKNDLMVA